MRQKICPKCSALSPLGAQSCLCGHQFTTQFAVGIPPLIVTTALPIPPANRKSKYLWILALPVIMVAIMCAIGESYTQAHAGDQHLTALWMQSSDGLDAIITNDGKVPIRGLHSVTFAESQSSKAGFNTGSNLVEIHGLFTSPRSKSDPREGPISDESDDLSDIDILPGQGCSFFTKAETQDFPPAITFYDERNNIVNVTNKLNPYIP